MTKANNTRTKWPKNTQKANLNLNQQSTLRTSHMCMHHCTTVIHNTVQNSLIIFPPDNHHCSDVTYWTGGGFYC